MGWVIGKKQFLHFFLSLLLFGSWRSTFISLSPRMSSACLVGRCEMLTSLNIHSTKKHTYEFGTDFEKKKLNRVRINPNV